MAGDELGTRSGLDEECTDRCVLCGAGPWGEAAGCLLRFGVRAGLSKLPAADIWTPVTAAMAVLGTGSPANSGVLVLHPAPAPFSFCVLGLRVQ